MSAGQRSVSQVYIDQMPVGQMYVNQMSVGQRAVGQMCVGQMSCWLNVFDQMTWSQDNLSCKIALGANAIKHSIQKCVKLVFLSLSYFTSLKFETKR
jgi:hypothetical protein